MEHSHLCIIHSFSAFPLHIRPLQRNKKHLICNHGLPAFLFEFWKNVWISASQHKGERTAAWHRLNTVSRTSFGFYNAISKHGRLCNVIYDDLAAITAFAIGIRCHPACFFKDLWEIRLGGKAAGVGNLCYGIICGFQQLLCLLYPQPDEIIDGGDALVLLKGMYQIKFIHIGFFT